jgi:uncharacterized protein (TIGR02996 family)
MTTDEPALRQAVMAAPGDDAPRAAYADWLGEQDDPHLRKYGEFVAAQLVVAKAGPEHKKIGFDGTGPMTVVSGGPDYWVGEDVDGLAAVGDRVDVKMITVPRAHTLLKRGLVVTRVTPRGYGTEYVLKADAASGPWAGAAALKAQTELLTAPNFWRWFRVPGWPGSPSAVVDGTDVTVSLPDDRRPPWVLHLARGFVSGVAIPVSDWLTHAAALYWRPDDPCRVRGLHHGDQCAGGRVGAPNAQFTTACLACKGTGLNPYQSTAQPVTRLTVTGYTCTSEEWARYIYTPYVGTASAAARDDTPYDDNYTNGWWWRVALRHHWPHIEVMSGTEDTDPPSERRP